MKLRTAFLSLLACLLLTNAIWCYCAYSKEAKASNSSEVLERLNLLIDVMQILRENYVDEEAVTPDRLLDNAIIGLASELDPYTEYMPPEVAEEFTKYFEANSFAGVGLQITMKNGWVTVVNTIEGTPAARAGVLPNDQIIAVDGESMDGKTTDEVVMLLRGEEGTTVSVTFHRPDLNEDISIELVRAEIPITHVDNVHILPETTIGYLGFHEFAGDAPQEFEKALRQLVEEEATAIIIDLRQNPGGFVDHAVEICSMFLPDKLLVVSIEGRNPDTTISHFTAQRYHLPDRIPVVLLIDGGSASAAEIMAQCLKDYNRVTLIGERTFGKGIVQTSFNMPQGGMLKLTIAKYFTKSRKPIHQQGIEPDIKVKLSRDEYVQLNSIFNRDEREKLDRCIQTAVAFIQGGCVLPESPEDPESPESPEDPEDPENQE
ncbi:MAG: S41 family peptidase [Victivallales bacterium]|nr:S41 family peptidase [Victivallales bacterium]